MKTLKEEIFGLFGSSQFREMDEILDFITSDTVLSTNLIVLIECFVIYFLFWLWYKLHDCCRKRAKHVVEEIIQDKDGVESSDINTLSDEAIVYNFLHQNYWCKKFPERSKKKKISEKDFRPTMRHFDKDRDIYIVYSKKTVWRLAFSENLESGLKEKFAFVFKGLRSWSVQETQGRFANVMQDLLEFRQVK